MPVVRFGLLDKAVAHEVPQPMLFAAAAVEFACVFLLSRGWLSASHKLQLLFLLGTTFLSFRLSAFHHLFVPHCGCWGPITLITERIGQGLEVVLVVFLIGIFLGYPLHVLLERLEAESAGEPGFGAPLSTAATSMGGAIPRRQA